ncbi:exopolysaccharide biosynthesis polyprenyl glycosylphosphotransferase [Dolichospermum sp. ST_sed3]|nr:exopolysaccharide biosynthesis polyprenyl glycosylphosphotransferase [Dolichospermum sp. ST_sed3]
MKNFLRKTILQTGDVAVFYLALLAVLFLRRPDLFSFSYYLMHCREFIPALLLWLIINQTIGLNNFRQLLELPALIQDIFLAFSVFLGLSIGIFYIMPQGFITPKTILLLTELLSSIGILFWRRAWLRLVNVEFLSIKVAMFGSNPLMEQIAKDLRSKQYSRFMIMDPGVKDLLLKAETDRAGASRDNSSRKNEVDLIVVDAGEAENDPASARKILDLATARNIPVWTHLVFYEEVYHKIPPESAGRPSWLFSNVLHGKKAVYFNLKSVLDSVLAGLAVVLLSPLFLLIIVFMKTCDGGRVFYSHRRLGYLEKEFTFWKFRTMREGADREGYLWNVGKKDPRVTRAGKILRRFRLDELPQLWNVFKGDMSLVGPRPTWVGERQALELPYYHIRHLVKPGLTGWAQINHKATDSIEDTIEKLQYDLYYVKHISFSLDIAIILKTLRRIFQPEHHFSIKK